MSTVVKSNHPLSEIISCKLFGINSVPDKERIAMISRCAKAAVNYVEQLELENSELKRQLEAQDVECGKLGSALCDIKRQLVEANSENKSLHRENIFLHKNPFCKMCGYPNEDDCLADDDCESCRMIRDYAAIKKQIQDGELVPVDVSEDWIFEHCLAIPVVGGMSLKQFAAERAGK